VSSTTLWFGPSERPLFGRLHVPDSGSARAAVLLCPPLGLESRCAARTYRILGERLEAKGFAVLGIDYQGTGDSSGSSDDPGQVSAWGASVHAGVDLMRSNGARSIAAVGMRLGATLLASVAGECGLDALVLWDPCDSGRSYLREQQALRSVHLGDKALHSTPSSQGDGAETSRVDAGEPGSIEVLSELYAAKTVEELSQLSIRSAEGDLAPRVLVLIRPERSPSRSMVDRLSLAHVEWGEAAGQQELVGVKPSIAQVPEVAVATITQWLSRTLPVDESAFSVPECERAVVERSDDDEIVEEIVRLGPLGLFGILTRARRQRSAVTAILLNSGTNDHVGPGRLWVHLARRWARAGLPALRVDLSGLGDSPVRPGQEQDVMYPPEVFDDLEEISKAISPVDPSAIVLVGLCSGGYHSIEGGVAMGVRGVCLVNPVMPRNPLNQPGRALAPRPAEPRRQATATRKAWVRKLPAHDRLAGLAERLPGAAWWLFDRVGVESPPARALELLVEHGVDTFVVCGEREARMIRRGETAVLRRLRRTGRFRLEVLPTIDHELFQRAARDLVEPMLTSHLVEHFAPTKLARDAVDELGV
jgi:alpha-beta hydrolase superfamily lysophospholipase